MSRFEKSSSVYHYSFAAMFVLLCLIRNKHRHASYRWPPAKLCSATVNFKARTKRFINWTILEVKLKFKSRLIMKQTSKEKLFYSWTVDILLGLKRDIIKKCRGLDLRAAVLWQTMGLDLKLAWRYIFLYSPPKKRKKKNITITIFLEFLALVGIPVFIL